jgi:YidC/Oxa1 family membrane protein insertase
MDLWQLWLTAIRELLQFLSTDVGFGSGLAVVALALLTRSALLPLSWTTAYRAVLRQRKLKALQPELAKLKEELAGQPQVYSTRMLALYRQHGISLVDGRSLLAAAVQTPVFIGTFQVLRSASIGGRFLWLASLARPDVALAVIAAVSTTLLVIVNPDLPEHLRWVMILLPAIVTLVAALKVASALALFWTVSNCFSSLQAASVYYVAGRRLQTQPGSRS